MKKMITSLSKEGTRGVVCPKKIMMDQENTTPLQPKPVIFVSSNLSIKSDSTRDRTGDLECVRLT